MSRQIDERAIVSGLPRCSVGNCPALFGEASISAPTLGLAGMCFCATGNTGGLGCW